jgi:hypothetical protein
MTPLLMDRYRDRLAGVLSCYDRIVPSGPKPTPAQAGDGNRGDQPVLALWAEQDVIIADEFRDGNSLPPRRRGSRPARATAGWSKRRWRM